ncbi:MAG: hypothetical protein VB092_02085 [Oscillospiraceae bacterium]|nr:hypothetical protein [Oscillospiraceae bacterium]
MKLTALTFSPTGAAPGHTAVCGGLSEARAEAGCGAALRFCLTLAYGARRRENELFLGAGASPAASGP